MIKIEGFKTGPVEANCYFIYNEENVIIVDPGDDAEKITAKITELKKKPVAILLTHTHYDHIGALEEIRKAYDLPVYVHPLEQEWLVDPAGNLSGLRPIDTIICQPAEYIFEEKTYTLGGMTFDVRFTPGHSQGGVSFVFSQANFVITGDALFAGSIGRTDLPTGSSEILLSSIKEQLFSLPEDYVIYPGHRGTSTIGFEKAHNPFFN